MTPLTRKLGLGAIAGLLLAAAPLAAATATVPRSTGGAGVTPSLSVSPSLDVPFGHGQDSDSLLCRPFAYSLGPFGPLGPWGPNGPLRDQPHPACFGGGPEFE
jgi:hypothetical protein